MADRDPEHPAYDPEVDPKYSTVIEDLYIGLDGIIGETLARLHADDTLIVLSDHGFTSWRRSFHLNTWLKEQGYLALLDPARHDDPGFFGNVDWSRTRAYALGLNGLYLNLRGRESAGAVTAEERDGLLGEIAAKLMQTIPKQVSAPLQRSIGEKTCTPIEGISTALQT